MAATLDPVRPIKLDEIKDARQRIAKTIVRTPLVRLELGPDFPDVRLKLENLQPINAYKLRGAANAVAMLPEPERKRGVWTISAGNAGQGVAYAARQAGVPCTVVAIETAPESKLARMRELGARLVLVSYEVAWRALDDRAFPGVDGTFVHPFDDHNFIAGHGSMGLEILEDAPDTNAIIAAIGGGVDRKSGQGPDRRHRFRRQHRPEEILRADRLISSMRVDHFAASSDIADEQDHENAVENDGSRRCLRAEIEKAVDEING